MFPKRARVPSSTGHSKNGVALFAGLRRLMQSRRDRPSGRMGSGSWKWNCKPDPSGRRRKGSGDRLRPGCGLRTTIFEFATTPIDCMMGLARPSHGCINARGRPQSSGDGARKQLRRAGGGVHRLVVIARGCGQEVGRNAAPARPAFPGLHAAVLTVSRSSLGVGKDVGESSKRAGRAEGLMMRCRPSLIPACNCSLSTARHTPEAQRMMTMVLKRRLHENLARRLW